LSREASRRDDEGAGGELGLGDFELAVGELLDGLGADDDGHRRLGIHRVDDGVGEDGAVGGELVVDALGLEALLGQHDAGVGLADVNVALQVRGGDGVLDRGDIGELVASRRRESLVKATARAACSSRLSPLDSWREKVTPLVKTTASLLSRVVMP
jgi:hypothetical protein